MFKLGDIIEYKQDPDIGLSLIEAIDKYFYTARYITGCFDGKQRYISIGTYSAENYKKVGNIFEKGGGGQ